MATGRGAATRPKRAHLEVDRLGQRVLDRDVDLRGPARKIRRRIASSQSEVVRAVLFEGVYICCSDCSVTCTARRTVDSIASDCSAGGRVDDTSTVYQR